MADEIKATVIVTGGCGFIGSNFLRHMVPKYPNYLFINVDKLTYAGNEENVADLILAPNYRFINEDICNREAIDKIITPDSIVINFAAESHVDASIIDPDVFARTNVMGTHNLLEVARKNKARLFLQISTDEVYGSLSPQSSSSLEDDNIHPSSPYSASKAAAEMLCLAAINTYKQPIIITRSSNNFGPYQFPEKIVPLFITNLIEGKKVPVYGTGNNIRDWIYVQDNCEAIDFIIHKGKTGEVYNIGGGNEISNLDLTKKIIINLGLDDSYIHHVADRLGHDFRYSLNSSKIQELGWKPRFDFNDALLLTINWYREHDSWWRPLKEKQSKSKNQCKYLIIGNGYLGQRIANYLPESSISNARIIDSDSVLVEIEKHNPEVVINAAGKTGTPNVDWCETHKEETFAGNVSVPLAIAEACRLAGKRMVHISSGCIYEGENNGKGFSEDDTPNFTGSYYSLTKATAEMRLQEFRVLQLRIRMPLDSIPHPRNLLNKLLGYSKIINTNNSITSIDDFLLILKQLVEKKATGIYNVVNRGSITHDEILKIYQEVSGKKITYELISPGTLDTMTRARRSNCVLSTNKLEAIGIQVPEVHDAVKNTIRKYVSHLSQESINSQNYSQRTIKGIVLAGGTGSRLYPLTKVTNKHLLPIYNDPMIYYPIRTLRNMGITDILIVSGREHCGHILSLLGSGKDLGVNLSYEIQEEAGGIAQALGLAEDFAKHDNIAVILGDNIFEDTFSSGNFSNGAKIFLKEVSDAQRFGVAEVRDGKVLNIEEKPENPKSSYAVTGLYIYDNKVFDIIKKLKPSARGELEITDVNNAYIARGEMSCEFVPGFWTDAGTFESLHRANCLTAEKLQKK